MPSIAMSIMQGPLCGALATMLLYGVICMQTFHYWQVYEHDKKILKFLTAHTALTIYAVEFYLIMHFGDTTSLEYAVWCVSYIIGFIIAYAANLFFYPKWKIFREHVYPTMVAGWVLSAVVDSAIAFTLCIYLRKRRTGMKRTDNVLNCLLLYSINTGAITSFCAVLVVIMFLGLPNNLAFIGFVQVQSKRVASSQMPRFSTFKPSQQVSSYLVCASQPFPFFHRLKSGRIL
ncbi:uncharacterized protein EDB93DRAFT_1241274 [Suillus bovinus]|uniref:uncharacterized protein n=1 Tax=Suillus bovinus TaxID=48563 RepID=UPI001B87E69B|nr:uncharacterized protein EDB93DRAFT_1241274 [Suillus bovinus]KAG2144393.1 hypothetical protein EDB93DRAFT_1241274 [Suillus bovinus]